MLSKIIYLFLLSTSYIFGNSVVTDFDLMAYRPIKVGLKDVYCEVRLAGLTEQIKKDYPTVRIREEVYYSFYWLYPGKMEVEVQGLPFGFEELKTKLKALITNQIEFIVPQDLSPKIRGYELLNKKTKNLTTLEGKDPTNKKVINKIELTFNARGILKNYKTFGSTGFQNSLFNFEKKSWSKNKWVMTEVDSKINRNQVIVNAHTKIKYENLLGFGMPVSVDIVTKVGAAGMDKSKNIAEKEIRSMTTISNYKLNAGEAQKFFRSEE